MSLQENAYFKVGHNRFHIPIHYTRATTSLLGSMGGRKGRSYCACALRLFLFQTHCTPEESSSTVHSEDGQCCRVDAYFAKGYTRGRFMSTTLPVDFSWHTNSTHQSRLSSHLKTAVFWHVAPCRLITATS
jgi:hypothetical protein